MSDRLRMDPMTAAEIEAYLDYSTQVCIDERVTLGGQDRRNAEEIEARQFAEDFPGGQPAPDHCLVTGRNAATGEPVGILWLFERTSAAGTSAFIYDVEVREDLRAQGWGRELMAYAGAVGPAARRSRDRAQRVRPQQRGPRALQLPRLPGARRHHGKATDALRWRTMRTTTP